MTASSIILDHIVPSCAALTEALTYASPLPAVLKAKSTQTLGDLNSVPIAVTLTVAISWFVYGCLKPDPYILSPQVVGICVAAYMITITLPLSDEKEQNRVSFVMVFNGLLFCVLGILTTWVLHSSSGRLMLWGTTANVVFLVFYASPLSTMITVIRTKNSASILLPLTLMQLVNVALWLAYAIAINDLYIALPSYGGAALCGAQLLLRFWYPAIPTAKTTNPDAVANVKYAALTEQKDGAVDEA